MAQAAQTPYPNRKKILWALIAVGALLLTAPSGFAQTNGPSPAGQPLTWESPDKLLPTQKLYESAICFIDDFETGGYTSGDPVILRTSGTCSGTATRDDVQLSGGDGEFAGQRIGGGFLNGRPLSAPDPAAKFWYHDEDGSASFSLADPVYVKLHPLGGDDIAISDIRITAYGNHSAGSSVRSGDRDFGGSLKALGTPGKQVRFVDTRGDGNYTSGDLLYLTSDPERKTVAAGDMQLTATHDERPYTSRVTHGSLETISAITMIDRPLCYVDQDASGSRSPADPLFISLKTKCSGPLTTGDIQISRSQDHEAGSRVDEEHRHHSATLLPLNDARLAYIDHTNTTSLTREDYILIQIDAHDADEVRPWDLLLTSTTRGAGTVLAPDDELIGTPIIGLGPTRNAVACAKTDTGSTPTPLDPFYLAPGAKTGDALRTTDIRLVPVAEHPFAGPVGLESAELLPKIIRKSARVCTTNESAEEYRRGHPVYLRVDGTCPETVQRELLRLVPVAEYGGLTTVQQNDTDLGEPLLAQPGTLQWKYHDDDEDGVFNGNEMLYLDIINPDNQTVGDGDTRVTTLGSMTGGAAVRTGQTDLGSPLTTLGKVSELTAYVETEQGRTLYITKDKASTHVLMGDVRLSALQAPFVAPQAESYQQPPADDAQGDPEPTDQENGFEDDFPPDGGGEDDEEPVPGPALGIFLAAVVAIAGWRRFYSR